MSSALISISYIELFVGYFDWKHAKRFLFKANFSPTVSVWEPECIFWVSIQKWQTNHNQPEMDTKASCRTFHSDHNSDVNIQQIN